jgi:hypothetical protein
VERQNSLPNDGNRLELADLIALPAQGAFAHIHFGYRRCYGSDTFNHWMDEKMGIGFLHVAVQQLHVVAQADGQVGGDCGFPGSALSAGDANDHLKSFFDSLLEFLCTTGIRGADDMAQQSGQQRLCRKGSMKAPFPLIPEPPYH